ncbi:MAG: ribosome silencing factor [Paracoccaceae bacterium]|nr:ribosome silencing factor [Paracoccaceae bacterium]
MYQTAKATASSVAGLAPMTAMPDEVTSDALLARILSSLDDDKAEEVVTIDLRGRSSVADYMVVCSGRSSRQVGAIAEKLMDRLKQDFGLICKIEGKDQGDWVLIDANDVVVHVFRPEVRDFYQLEKMWIPSGADITATTN